MDNDYSKIISFFGILFLLVTLINFVNAFSIKSEIASNVVCPSSTIVIEEKITADMDADFQVVTAGSASSFATVLPMSFHLSEGENKGVFVYLTPSTGVLPGIYELLISIANGYETKQVMHEIIVENCNVISLNVEPQKSICSCESTTYNAVLSNSGLYRERYTLELFGPAKNFSQLSTDIIALDPGETKNFSIYFSPPCNTPPGNYTFTVKAQSLDSNAIALAEGKVYVNNCYNYLLDAEQNFYSICDGDQQIAKINLENRGTSPNYYEINLKGPRFAHLDKNSLELNSGEKAEINIYLTPDLGEKQGNYSLEIKSLSEKGKILANEKLFAEVKECHSAEVSFIFYKEKDRICNALTNTYGVELKNLGKKLADYAITIDGPDWVRLSNTTLQLEPNSTATLWVEVSPPYGTRAGVYEIKINARDRNSKVALSDTLKIETLTKFDCYKPKISAEETEIKVEKDKTYVAIFTVENTGARKATYFIDVSGNANKFISVTPSVIELEPGKAESVYVYIAPSLRTPVGKYVLTLSTRLNDTTMLASKTIYIDVIMPKMVEKIKKPEKNVTLPVEEKKEEENIWQKIITWFKSLFRKKEIVSREHNIKNRTEETNQIANQTFKEKNQSIENESNIANLDVDNANATNLNINVTNETSTTGLGIQNKSQNLTEVQKVNETYGQVVNESLNETNITNTTNIGGVSNVTNKSDVTNQTQDLSGAIGSETRETKLEFRNVLVRYRIPIIVILIFIALILLLSIFDVWKSILKFFK